MTAANAPAYVALPDDAFSSFPCSQSNTLTSEDNVSREKERADG